MELKHRDETQTVEPQKCTDEGDELFNEGHQNYMCEITCNELYPHVMG